MPATVNDAGPIHLGLATYRRRSANCAVREGQDLFSASYISAIIAQLIALFLFEVMVIDTPDLFRTQHLKYSGMIAYAPWLVPNSIAVKIAC